MAAEFVALREVIDAAEETEGADELERALAALEVDIETKAANIAAIIRDLAGECDILRAEEKRLADRRRSRENSIARLKSYLQENMVLTGRQKVATPLYTISLQKNPPSVKVVDETAIPAGWWIPSAPKLDRAGLLQELKLGHAIPGAELDQSVGVRIR